MLECDCCQEAADQLLDKTKSSYITYITPELVADVVALFTQRVQAGEFVIGEDRVRWDKLPAKEGELLPAIVPELSPMVLVYAADGKSYDKEIPLCDKINSVVINATAARLFSQRLHEMSPDQQMKVLGIKIPSVEDILNQASAAKSTDK